MFRILDRYLVREIVAPFFMGLAVLTFILEIPPILTQAEQFVSKGVEWSIVIRVLGLLLPQALCLTIPMAVLLGILVGFSRLSADREFVAMQACGISLVRLAPAVPLCGRAGDGPRGGGGRSCWWPGWARPRRRTKRSSRCPTPTRRIARSCSSSWRLVSKATS